MSVKIGHARIDENGKIYNGAAGDQTGKEVMVSNWYDGGWTHVFRAKDSKAAEKIAKCCEQACANDNIGYDQWQRTTLFTAAQKVNFDLSKITTKVETDCSALVAVCCNAAGFKVSKDMYTGNEQKYIMDTKGFDMFTDKDHLKSSDNLKRGDILMKGSHTAMVLSNGKNIKTTTTTTGNITPTPTPEFKSFTAYVTHVATTLNVRRGAGKNYGIIGELTNNTKLTVIGEKGNWWQVKVNDLEGFVSKDYITKTAPSTAYKAVVTAGRLNVRKGAGTRYSPIKIITKGTALTIYKTSGNWGKISSTKEEWVCLDYVKKA